MTGTSPGNDIPSRNDCDRIDTVKFIRRTDAANMPQPALDVLLADKSTQSSNEAAPSSMAKTEVECFDAMSLGWIIPAPDSPLKYSDNKQQHSDMDTCVIDDEHTTIDTGWTLTDTGSEYLVAELLNHIDQAISVYPTVLSSGDRISVHVPNSTPKAIEPAQPLCQLLPLTQKPGTLSYSIEALQESDMLTVTRGDTWTESRKAEYISDRNADHHFSTHKSDSEPTK